MVNIDLLTKKYFSKGEPCPYKLKSDIEILIYPILVKDYEEYDSCKGVLEINKNDIGIQEFIQMSQLEYLNYLFSINEIIEEEKISIGELQLQMFKNIFSLCLREDYVAIARDNNGKYIVVVANKIEKIDENGNKVEDFICKYTISNKQFIEISKIILFQNDIDYDDRYINPDVLKEYNEMLKLKYKGMREPTFEERKVFVLARYRCKLEDLNNMTKRFFDMLYSEYIKSEQYFVDVMYKTSQKFDIKENPVYPLFKPKEDKFKDLFMSTESLNSKLGN